jgi:Pyruvate/2-oxoacid:ferredoxin oxidoreductase delta subunit
MSVGEYPENGQWRDTDSLYFPRGVIFDRNLSEVQPYDQEQVKEYITSSWYEYSGGDDVELGLVTIAIAQGRFAAQAIDARFRGTPLEKPPAMPLIKNDRMKLAWYKEAFRNERTHVPPAERGMDTEIERGLTEEEALAEAKRCMSCGMCMDCETCWMYCTNNAFVKLPKGEHYKVKLEVCNGCKKCAEECPCGYIEMV